VSVEPGRERAACQTPAVCRVGFRKQSGFASGENSLGSTGGRQSAGDGTVAVGFDFGNDSEQIDQGIDGERVAVDMFISSPGSRCARYSVSSAAWMCRVATSCAEGGDVISREGPCSRPCARRGCRPWRPLSRA
jgi:hypothetical protein